MKSQGKKLKKHRSQRMFLYYLCFSGMHKIVSSGQNFRGHCFTYLLNLLSTLLKGNEALGKKNFFSKARKYGEEIKVLK